MKTSKMNALNVFVATIALALSALAVGAQVIYDNGGLATGATSKSGVAAPAGTQWAEVQNNSFDTTSSNTTGGVGCQVIAPATSNRCADDFVIPPGETWTINSVTVFAYQTGFAGGTSPFVGANLRIWNGTPEGATSTVVFGDTTTNRIGTSTNSNLFRIFNSAVPAPGTAPGTTRIIWQTNINVSPAAVLPAGHYWIDFQLDAGATGNFAPSTTIVGTRGTSIYNARQKITGGSFVALVDGGNPAAAPDFGVDFPFKINGSVAGSIGARRSRAVDMNGDNKTDFVIARAATAGAQTAWWVLDSTSATSGASFGLGVGISGGDRAVPEDYDGDGKTDIAVWRPGAANVAAFYILQSSTSTVNTQLFGQTGDDPSIVDDYDGDGKADVAVYRDGGVGQSIFFYRGTNANPGGNTTYNPWGIGGDKAVPGDYDGDRKADLAVVRNNGGGAVMYQRLSGGGDQIVNFGLFTDRFAPGDYDGDNKTDICVVRTNAGLFEWYVLRSSDSTVITSIFGGGWGNPTTDIIAQGDYDGDNRTDFAVWRTAGADNGTFYVAPSAGAVFGTKWGNAAGTLTTPDYPVANFNVR